MIRKVIEIAEKTGQKAVRLDVLNGNISAERLRLGHGFQYVDTLQMFYEDTGDGQPSSCLSMLFQREREAMIPHFLFDFFAKSIDKHQGFAYNDT